MKQDNKKTDDLDIEAPRLVSGGFEVMHQTGEYDWEQSCGPYKTAEEAEAAQALSDPSGSRNYHGFDQHYIDIQPDVVIVSYEVIKENK